ncbi:MAG: NF038122 family metalloprotease [Cyanobacteria bacterium P01_A01_bin.105]
MKILGCNISQWIAPAAIASGLCLFGQSPAQALKFNLSYDEGTSYYEMMGFEMAAGVWSSYLSDDVTVNLHVGTSAYLPDKVVGGALPAMYSFQNYGTYTSKLQADALGHSQDDAKVVFGGGLQSYRQNGKQAFRGRLEGNSYYSTKMSLTRANAKAVGMIDAHDSGLDGVIMLNDLKRSRYRWNQDFDRTAGIGNTALDFLGVAVHEIGHALGFVSALDTVKKSDHQTNNAEDTRRIQRSTPLDLLRRSPVTSRWGRVELRPGYKDAYLTFDGGQSKVADFARGARNVGSGSDGYQTSHWKHQNSGALGIMGPAIRLGERRNVAALDLRAMDAIGWDLAVLDPSTGQYNSNMTSENLNISAPNLRKLQNQAEYRMAQKLGISVSKLRSQRGHWARQLDTQNTDALADMLSQTDEYYQLLELDYGGWWQELLELGYGGWWQEYLTSGDYMQQAFYSTLEEPDAPEPVDVPEPTSVLSLLGVAVLGYLVRSRHRDATV